MTISLLSHQLLLQLIGSLLLDGSELPPLQGVAGALLRQLSTPSSSGSSVKAGEQLPGTIRLGIVNGFADSGQMSLMQSSSITTLLLCLDASFQVSHDFDSRPGLKFLLQKVFSSSLAANLYRQTATAWAIRHMTMYEVARRAQVTRCVAKTYI